MNTEPLTYASRTAPSESLRGSFLQLLQVISTIFRALFVIDAPLRSAHGALIRGLFMTYLLASLLIFGPSAILIMPAYQLGFKLLLRAAF